MSDFVDAATALQSAGADTDLCPPFMAALPVAGVSISTLAEPFDAETVCASSPRAVHLDEIQLDLGEGPCWEAMLTDRPVLTPDVRAAASERWPTALHALQRSDFGGVFAFPMRIGTIRLGAVDMYTDTASSPSSAFVADASALAAIVSRQVLHRALMAVERAGSGEMPQGEYSRREIHQASGMIAAQLTVTVEDALLILRGNAFSADRSVSEVAADVVARRLDFSSPNASDHPNASES